MNSETARAAATTDAWIGGSALRGPLLGLLLRQEQPTGAYRLASLLMQRLPLWGVTASGVAGLLARLADEGFVARTPGHSKTYSATDKAALALEAWMQRPVPRQSVREELHARIASSSVRHAPLLLKALDAYEQECFQMLAGGPSLDATKGSWTSLTINLTHAATDENLHASIKWSKIARQWIEEWVEDSSAQMDSDRDDDPSVA